MTKAVEETVEVLKPFDFDDLDIAVAADNPYEFEIVHPETKDGLGVFISVKGAESETFQRYLREESNKARRKAFQSQRSGKTEEPATVEEDEEKVLRAIAVCMTGWRTIIDGKSEPVILWANKKLDFSKDNAIIWMRKFRWVRSQINEATAELRNFIKD